MENANCFAADHGVAAFIRNIVQGCFIFACVWAVEKNGGG